MTNQIVVIEKTAAGYEMSNDQGADVVTYEMWEQVAAILEKWGFGASFIASRHEIVSRTGSTTIVPN